MRRKAKLLEDTSRFHDLWGIVLLLMGILCVGGLAFSLYQAYLLLLDIMNAPAGEAHLIERGMR